MEVEPEPRPLFSITVRRDEAGPVLAVVGDVDLASAPSMRARLLTAIDISDGGVTVDLAKVTFMDSTGLSVLIMAHKRLERDGRQLRLRSPSPEVIRVVNLTGLGTVFHIDSES